MATSSLRYALLVLAVVLGIVVVRSGFPGNATEGVAAGPGGTGKGGGTLISPIPSTTTPSPKVAGKIKGVAIQVLNGTEETGLAGSTQQSLEGAGYKAGAEPSNAPHLYQHTTIYYQADQRANAELMQTRFFPFAVLKTAPSSVPASVDLQVVLGTDFVNQASPSASPSS